MSSLATSSAGREPDQQDVRRDWSNDMKARLKVSTEVEQGRLWVQGRWVEKVIYLLA